MSARVAYFERADRGVRPVGVRLVGERTDEDHRCPEGPALPVLAGAAAWLRERLPKPSGIARPVLDVLCVDVDGALCSWLTAPSPDTRVVEALARQGGSDWTGESDDAGTSARPPSVMTAYAGMPGEAAVQALAPPEAHPRERPRTNGKATPAAPAAAEPKMRLPVLAVPDGAARLLVDALDESGVRVDRVCSLWHALAEAWDRSRAERAGGPEGVVAESSPLSASVIVDPAGRLLWSWSRKGTLIAAGSMRLRVERGAEGEGGPVRVRSRDVSRLATEWMAWSAQLSAAPARLTCVTPELGGADGAEPDALDAAGLGVALGRALPGATVDLAVDGDPVGTTLRRVAAGATAAEESGAPLSARLDAGASLVSLTSRPGQAHFRLYLWAALMIAMGAAGVGALAWKFRAETTSLRDGARKTAAQARDLLQGLSIPPPFPGKELETVQARVATLEQQQTPVKPVEPTMPVLHELETVSLVLAVEDIDIESVQLDSRATNKVVVQVPTLEEGEQLFTALRTVGGSNLTDWTSGYAAPQNGKIRCTFTAGWSPELRRTGTEGPR